MYSQYNNKKKEKKIEKCSWDKESREGSKDNTKIWNLHVRRLVILIEIRHKKGRVALGRNNNPL
jgi:hypothetical protein